MHFRCVTPVEVLQMNRAQFQSLIGDGETAFARAAKNVLKQRQHRWVSNLLSLAQADQKAQCGAGSSEAGDGEDPANTGVTRVILRLGDEVFRELAPADAVWFIHRGAVELSTVDTETGVRRVASILGPGDTIGLESLREASATMATFTRARLLTYLRLTQRAQRPVP